MVHHALFYINVGVAGDAEQALFLDGILAEDEGRVMQHQFLCQGKLGLALPAHQDQPLHLAGDGDHSKALALLFLEQSAQVDFLIAQERERVAVVHDLRAEDGEHLVLEVLFPEALLLLIHRIKVHLFIAAGIQIFQRFLVVFIAILLQMGNLGHDGVQLFLGRHVGLVLTLVLVFLTACKVGALLQGAYTHHEKFIQIGAIDGKEFHLLCQRDILILAQHQHTAVKVQPAEFTVDEDRILFHSSLLPFSLTCGFRRSASAHISKPIPLIHHCFRQAGHSSSLFHRSKAPVLLPVFNDGPGALLPHSRQGTESVLPGGVQIDPRQLDERCFTPGCTARPCLPRNGKPKRQRDAHRADKGRCPQKSLFRFCETGFLHSIVPDFL